MIIKMSGRRSLHFDYKKRKGVILDKTERGKVLCISINEIFKYISDKYEFQRAAWDETQMCLKILVHNDELEELSTGMQYPEQQVSIVIENMEIIFKEIENDT